MFKSPTGKISMQKKNSVNFIRNAASPKIIKFNEVSSAKNLHSNEHEAYL